MALIKSKYIVQLSEDLLLKVKMQESFDELVKELENLEIETLKDSLPGDTEKKAFWINIYNAYFQILRKVNKVENSSIFTKKLISLANRKWSLDDIEHGILRRYRFKYSLGYLPQLFVPRIIKKLSVSRIDYRIHFALNCGAKSCPPIAFYSSDKLDNQLNLATQAFLESETDYMGDKKEVRVSRILFWFLGDFGGKKGIRKILKDKINLDVTGFKIVFKQYSWDELLDNYSE